jgi:uncharacterized membrane protein
MKGRVRTLSRFVSNNVEYLFVTVYFILVSYLSILRYLAFTDAWDFGGFVQSLSNASHGGFFLQTIDGFFAIGFPQSQVIPFFALHFSPILYLFVPVYAAFPFPQTLLVVQTAFIALGGLPVYWLAKKRLGARVGIVFLILYLTYAPLLNTNLNDFHPESFLVSFMLYAIYFMLDKRWKEATPFVILTLTVIEEAAILVVALIAFVFVYHRVWKDRKTATLLVCVSLGSVVYMIIALQLRFYFGLDPNGFTVPLNAQNYSMLQATSALGVPFAVFQSPQRVFQALMFQFPQKIGFLFELVIPVSFLPFFFPEGFILALPWLSVAFLSKIGRAHV